MGHKEKDMKDGIIDFKGQIEHDLQHNREDFLFSENHVAV
jgi:hypothetical protein